MGLITGVKREAAEITSDLHAWLRSKLPDGAEVKISELEWFDDNGVSSETVAFWMDRQDSKGAHRDKFILRLPPTVSSRAVFPTYDFARQASAQAALFERGIPVPAPIGAESGGELLGGAGFMVMPYISGRIPDMRFPSAGWVRDLPPVDQRTLMSSFVTSMAGIHALEWDHTALEGLARDTGPGLDSEWQWWESYRAWASASGDPNENESVAALAGWCKRNWPTSEPPSSVIWGDPRIGNAIFNDDLSVRALLDWESVAIAPAEVDLGWHFAFRKTNAAIHRVHTFPELDGFPTMSEEIELWEGIVGRPVHDLDWYMMFGALRLADCMLSLRRTARAIGNEKFLFAPILPDWVLARL